MDFTWNDAQLAHRDRIIAFAKAHLGRDLQRRDAEQVFDAAGWRACAKEGLTGLVVPRSYGGAGADPLTAALMLEALGYGCRDNGLIMALGAHLWGCTYPIVWAGTEAQKKNWLPRLCGGAIGALAATEPGAGSDIGAIQTTAAASGGRYVLNGDKAFVTNGPIADVFLVLAKTDPGKKHLGLALFLVDRGTPGLTIGAAESKTGLRTAAMGSLSLHDCTVPESALVGRDGAGLAIFQTIMEWERSFILAPAVGSMARLLEEAHSFAHKRRQFDVAIASFHNVAARLADARLRIETSRLLLYRTAWLKGTKRRDASAAAMTKLQISESWIRTCQEVLEVYGGLGYLSATGVERELRDALSSRIYSGTSDIQRAIIARATFSGA